MLVDGRSHFHFAFLLYLLQAHESCLPPHSIFAIHGKHIESHLAVSGWSWYHLETVTQNGTRTF